MRQGSLNRMLCHAVLLGYALDEHVIMAERSVGVFIFRVSYHLRVSSTIMVD